VSWTSRSAAGLVDNRDGALNADVNASLHASPISILFGNTNSAWLRRRLRIKCAAIVRRALARASFTSRCDRINVAIVWGPQAAWFASQQQTPLRVTPVADSRGNLPMSFNIAMGVRKQDAQLASELEAAMNRRHAEIDAILAAYHVPRFPIPTERAEATP